ncbi:uncharacterized protein B0T23DRAFT_41086 [Neurospora hispaniola]|uniref:Uncharacterized protein n=1 Tax=Neurospora hispaniola TaxID=588809 RepID=A0AAJ0IHH9_9PEZI|nr:hypothetical protein B0T23DRAFT_41086 [Neurospora hispaniola]
MDGGLVLRYHVLLLFCEFFGLWATPLQSVHSFLIDVSLGAVLLLLLFLALFRFLFSFLFFLFSRKLSTIPRAQISTHLQFGFVPFSPAVASMLYPEPV